MPDTDIIPPGSFTLSETSLSFGPDAYDLFKENISQIQAPVIVWIRAGHFSFHIEMGGTQSTAAKGNGYHILRVSIKFLIYYWKI